MKAVFTIFGLVICSIVYAQPSNSNDAAQLQDAILYLNAQTINLCCADSLTIVNTTTLVRNRFEEIINNYPDSDLKDDAQYFIGKIYQYGFTPQNQYLEWQKIIDLYPGQYFSTISLQSSWLSIHPNPGLSFARSDAWAMQAIAESFLNDNDPNNDISGFQLIDTIVANFPDVCQSAQALLMKGDYHNILHQRHEAVEKYKEVLDLFPQCLETCGFAYDRIGAMMAVIGDWAVIDTFRQKLENEYCLSNHLSEGNFAILQNYRWNRPTPFVLSLYANASDAIDSMLVDSVITIFETQFPDIVSFNWVEEQSQGGNTYNGVDIEIRFWPFSFGYAQRGGISNAPFIEATRCIIEVPKNPLFPSRLKTLVHEMGHALGLGHSYNNEDIMFYSTSQVAEPVLSERDITTLQMLYGPYVIDTIFKYENDTTFLYDGSKHYFPGEYTTRIFNKNSCDSVKFIHLNILQGIQGEKMICSGTDIVYSYTAPPIPGADSYQWNLSSGGTFATASISNSIGIIWTGDPGSTHTLSLTATNAISGLSTTSTYLVNILPIPVITAEPVAQIPCTGMTEIYSVAPVPGATFQWNLSSGGTIASPTVSNSVAITWTGEPGSTHTLSLMTSDTGSGCSSTSTYTVDIPPVPVITSQPEDQTLCAGATVADLTVSATNLNSSMVPVGALSYQWYKDGAAVIGATSASYLPDNTGSASYYVEVTVNGLSCATVTSTTVNVIVNVISEAAVTPSAVSICTGESTTLTASQSSGLSFNWSTGETTASITASPTTTTTYTLTVTDVNNCTASSSVTVTVNEVPVASLAPSTLTICSGSSTTLTASPAGLNYTWSNSTETSQSITVNPTATTTYTLTVMDNFNCFSTATATVTVVEPPTITAPSSVCSGTPISVSGSLSNSTWESSGSGMFADVSALSTIYTPSAMDITAGTVTLTLTSAVPVGPCNSESVSTTVSISETPSPTITPTATNICAFGGTDITFNTTGGAGIFSFSPSTAASALMGTATMTVLDVGTVCAGDYIVSFTVANASCSTTVSSTVTVTACGIAQSGMLKFVDQMTQGVANAAVALIGGTSPAVPQNSALDGSYSVNNSDGTSFVITPQKNRTWNLGGSDGISSADASRILQHVGALPANRLTSPYKRIAADVNNDLKITGFDAALVLQALTGSISARNRFTSRTWVFVPESQTLTNNDMVGTPTFGWINEAYQTSLAINDPCATTNGNFIGVKVGDVIGTGTDPGAEFTTISGSDLGWMVTDVALNAGTEAVAEFHVLGIENLMAYQFALGYDVEKLEFVGVEPVSGSPLIPTFGDADEGVLRTAFASGQGRNLMSDTPVFRVRFRVLEGGGMLSEALEIDQTAMTPEVYTMNDYRKGGVNLWFTTMTSIETLTKGGLSLHQNRPNPFSSKTTIGYIVPESCEVRIRIYESSGRLIAEQKAWSAAGYHNMEFNLENNRSAGLLYYELITPMGSLARKMVIMQE